MYFAMALQILNLDWIPYDENIDLPEFDFWKTKRIFEMPDRSFALERKDIITAYDNPEFTWLAPGKWVTSAYSSALLFKRLEAAWVNTSHKGIINANTTRETPLDMLPFEIIWRRYNVEWNSWNERNPNNKYKVGEKYDEVIYEACLKWSVITSSNEVVHDPFLVLDKDFKPQLNSKGLPRLTHSKTGEELTYDNVVHPNKWWHLPLDVVREAVELFTEKSGEIYEMFKKIQQVTHDTYAPTGRLNADGKWEVWLNRKTRELTLWDEIELDSVRNMSLKKIKINGRDRNFKQDLLGNSLEDILNQSPEAITRIIKAYHSGKQHYRNQVNEMKGLPFDDKRKAFNNAAAERTTREVYIPSAMALSDKFWKEVWFILSN